MKKQKGITLIALIITIIILLILAMVTIKILVNVGIIDKAKKGVNDYSEEEIKEQIQLAYSNYQMEKLTNENYTFEKALQDGDVEYKSVTGSDEEGYVITVETRNEEKQYTVSASGVAKVKTLEDYGVKIGDYVNYDEGTGYTYFVNPELGAGLSKSYGTDPRKRILQSGTVETENLKWRVFGVDDYGCLKLISNQPTTQCIVLGNEEGYVNEDKILNGFCDELYGKSNFAKYARSFNMEDLEQVAGAIRKKNANQNYGRLVQYRYEEEGISLEYRTSTDDGNTWSNWNSFNDSKNFYYPGKGLVVGENKRGVSDIYKDNDLSSFLWSDEIASEYKNIQDILRDNNNFWIESRIVNTTYGIYSILSRSSSHSTFTYEGSSGECASNAVLPIVVLKDNISLDWNENMKDWEIK